MSSSTASARPFVLVFLVARKLGTGRRSISSSLFLSHVEETHRQTAFSWPRAPKCLDSATLKRRRRVARGVRRLYRTSPAEARARYRSHPQVLLVHPDTSTYVFPLATLPVDESFLFQRSSII